MTSSSPFSDDKSGLCQGKRQELGCKEQSSSAAPSPTPSAEHSPTGWDGDFKTSHLLPSEFVGHIARYPRGSRNVGKEEGMFLFY